MGDVSTKQKTSASSTSSRRRTRPAVRALRLVTRLAPGLKPVTQKAMIRAGYELVSLFNRDADKSFMNYGYAPLEGPPDELELRPEDQANRYCIQLYNAVAHPVDLAGKDVLEVGSGRGGGASFITRYLSPRTYIGIDLAAKAVSLATARYTLPGLSFKQGDAEHLPVPSSAFDAVVNVESSHSYPSVPKFLSEVSRVLRPGGHLLFADMRLSGAVDELRQQFEQSGLEILQEERITPNVTRALDLDYQRRQAMVPRRAPKWVKEVAASFLGVTNGELYNSFSSGRLVYVRYLLRKPVSTPEQVGSRNDG